MIAPVFANRYGFLYQGDCMDLFAALKDRSIDCVFADSPLREAGRGIRQQRYRHAQRGRVRARQRPHQHRRGLLQPRQTSVSSISATTRVKSATWSGLEWALPRCPVKDSCCGPSVRRALDERG